MDLANIINKYLMLMEKLVPSNPGNIVRDVYSRYENPLIYVGETEPENPVYKGARLIEILDFDKPDMSNKKWVTVGLDGSSRAIDTPYMFIGLASTSIFSSILGEVFDHPALPAKYLLPKMNTPFIAIAPDFHLDNVEKNLEQYVYLRSPAGVLYDKSYNKSLILDELRTCLENKTIGHLANNIDYLNKVLNKYYYLTVLIDGPIYPVPILFKQHYNMLTKNLPSRGRLDDYVVSWKEILKHRIEVLSLLEKQGIPVIGIVKRVETSRILLSTRNYIELAKDNNVWIGDLGNDQAFIDTLIKAFIRKGVLRQPHKVMYIGPIYIPPEATYLNHYLDYVPEKIVYYVIVPVNKYGKEVFMYTLFRIEVTSNTHKILGDNNILSIVLQDSVFYGTTLPISILYSDKRSKKISRSLANIIARDLERRGIPLTYDTIRAIEAYQYW